MFCFQKTRAFTVVEAMMVLGIFSIVALGAAWFVTKGNRDTAIIWEQLMTQNEGRKALKHVVNDVRRAEVSSIGSFPIATVGDYELIFYANIDDDLLRERVRFWLDGTTLKKGVVKPGGEPLTYTGSEAVVEIAHSVVNQEKVVPIFSYFDESYTGSESPLVKPISITDVHVIRISLELEKDPTETPVPLHVESTAHVRNLKTN